MYRWRGCSPPSSGQVCSLFSIFFDHLFAIAIILSLTMSQNTCPCFWQCIQRIFPNSKPLPSALSTFSVSKRWPWMDGITHVPTCESGFTHFGFLHRNSRHAMPCLHATIHMYVNPCALHDHQCPTAVTPRMSTCPPEKEGRHAKLVYVALHVLSC